MNASGYPFAFGVALLSLARSHHGGLELAPRDGGGLIARLTLLR